MDRDQARQALQFYHLRDRGFKELFEQVTPPPGHPVVEQERIAAQNLKFDFTSDQFDAQLALSINNALPIPFFSPDMRPLDNISKCRFFLPKSCDDYTPSISVDPPSKPPPKKMAPVLSLGGVGLLRSVMDNTVARCGPFRFMYRLLDEKCVTAVLIRNATGIRGVCLGILRAFDRHLNLHLSNVVEDVSFRTACLRKVRKDYGGKDGTRHPCPKPPRRIKNLLIRGDNVALIWKIRDGVSERRIPGRRSKPENTKSEMTKKSELTIV